MNLLLLLAKSLAKLSGDEFSLSIHHPIQMLSVSPVLSDLLSLI